MKRQVNNNVDLKPKFKTGRDNEYKIEKILDNIVYTNKT